VRVVLTGTPGTGKTTATDRLPGTYEAVHLNEVVEREGLWTDRDADRDSLIVDVDALSAWVDDHVATPKSREENDGTDAVVVLESHLAHLLDADRVVVLRCRPDVLESRLRERGVSEAKAAENAESEALDVILSEAVGDHGAEHVYEIDTTDRSPDEVAAEIERVVAGERDPSAGEVDFTDYLHP
jgi:adenylate kinase